MTDDPADLSNLHDIVVPDAVPWWPPAPGVWLLLVLGLVLVLVLATRSILRWRADAYRRAALSELENATTAPQIAEILRRTALAIAPRDTVAALDGKSWTDWLAERSPEPLTDEVRTTLAGSIYDPSRSESADQLRAFADRWIRRHTRQC